MFHVPEKFRVRTGIMGSDVTFGNNGAFEVSIVLNKCKQKLFVIASDQVGWEHVSVSRTDRCPLWDEMCAIKDLFWDESDCVIQYHPPISEYINNHRFCLHLWRPVGIDVIQPPKILVGIEQE